MGQLRLVWYLFLAVSFDFSAVTCVTPANVKAIARQFGKMLVEGTADVAVQLEDLQTRYRSSKSLKVTKYDPAAVLEEMRSAVNKYMMDKTDATLRLVESAEGSWKSYNYEEWYNDGCVNNLNSGDDKTCLYHFYSARCNSKYNEDHDGNPIDGCGKCPECFDNRIVLSGLLCLNASSEADCAPNSKFFGKSVSTKSSAVHVPTAVYDRGTDILYKIRWTDPTGDGSGFFDATVQENLKKDPSLTWQFFCSNTGFFRFHPGAPWFFDQDHLDMYDCRLQQWYINAATNPKLMVILLDTSGSMLGQRYEIAKQAIEMIMDTLSENDYFNIIMFNKEPFFVSPCLGERLIQATLRNKRILRYALNDNLKYIEGVASYDKAFRKAFNLLKVKLMRQKK